MPKQKSSLKSKISAIIKKYPKELEVSRDGKGNDKLMCKLCVQEITFDDSHGSNSVNMHFRTKKHQKNKDCKTNGFQQEFIDNSFKNSEENLIKNEFFADITKWFIEADIPLNKLEHLASQKFLKKYTNRDVPNSSTLRKNYVPNVLIDASSTLFS